MRNPLSPLKSIPALLLVSGALMFAGCDDDSSATDPDTGGETTISGRVTDDAGFSKAGDVEDANVRAEEVDDDGARQPASGETTTDSDGSYTLETEADARVMIVTATKADFQSEVLVVNQANTATVAAMEMNEETRAEARVYTEAKALDDEAHAVTAGDVAFQVDAQTAASMRTNAASSSEIGSALHSSVQAELMYLSEAGVSASDMETIVNSKTNAFVSLQSSLAAGSNNSTALEVFTSSMADAHADAGIDVTLSAESRQAAGLAVANLATNLDSGVRLALRKRVEIMAAMSTAAAIEAEFRSEGSLDAEADAVENAGLTLAASIAAASSESDIEDAWAAFESETKAQLSAGITLGAALLQTVEASLLSLKTTFDGSIAAASSVDSVVRLKAEYHAEAKAEAESDLSSLANAEFAARVLTLASAH